MPVARVHLAAQRGAVPPRQRSYQETPGYRPRQLVTGRGAFLPALAMRQFPARAPAPAPTQMLAPRLPWGRYTVPFPRQGARRSRRPTLGNPTGAYTALGDPLAGWFKKIRRAVEKVVKAPIKAAMAPVKIIARPKEAGQILKKTAKEFVEAAVKAPIKAIEAPIEAVSTILPKAARPVFKMTMTPTALFKGQPLKEAKVFLQKTGGTGFPKRTAGVALQAIAPVASFFGPWGSVVASAASIGGQMLAAKKGRPLTVWKKPGVVLSKALISAVPGRALSTSAKVVASEVARQQAERAAKALGPPTGGEYPIGDPTVGTTWPETPVVMPATPEGWGTVAQPVGPEASAVMPWWTGGSPGSPTDWSTGAPGAPAGAPVQAGAVAGGPLLLGGGLLLATMVAGG